jgi:nitroreductase
VASGLQFAPKLKRAQSIGCGTCAIAAYRQEELDRFLGLDGEEELVVYLAPVGKVEGA